MEDGERTTVASFRGSQSLVRLHPSMAQHLKVAVGTECTCSFGKTLVRATVWYDGTISPSQVEVSSGLADRLHMSAYVEGNVTATIGVKRIVFGPLLGILCNPIWNAKLEFLRNQKQLPVLEKLSQFAVEEDTACFIFGLNDVDFENACVTGYTKLQGKWKPGTFPLPDVIYDQLISRRVERCKDLFKNRQRLSEMYNTRLFNDGFFDKLQVNEWLSQDVRMRSHLPEATKYTRLQDAAVFAARHHMTFLKPVHGSLGLGIIRFVRLPDGSVQFDVKRQNQPPTRGKAKSPQDALLTFKKRLASKPYILQQGIQLACFQERPFDLRVLVQKDGFGTWRRTKMFARIAKEGEFTSNLTAGGDALPVSTVLETIFPNRDKRRKILNQVRKVSITTAEVIERASGKLFGELGIDLGIDVLGGVWIIEVNSKPWKAPVTEKGRTDLVDLAFIRPIQYAKHLARGE